MAGFPLLGWKAVRVPEGGWQNRTDVVTTLFVTVFAYGTAIHAVQLIADGLHAYPEAPLLIRSFFTALVALDPLAAILILQRRRIGLMIGNCVLILDAAANAIVSYPPLNTAPGITSARIGQAVVTLLAVVLVVSTPGLWRRYQ